MREAPNVMNPYFPLRFGISAGVVILMLVLSAFQKSQHPLTIEQIKEKYESDMMAIAGVVGVGIGQCEDQACIKVYVEKASPETERKIPQQLEGVKVETERLGSIKALPHQRK
jgi:hypothetical protein